MSTTTPPPPEPDRVPGPTTAATTPAATSPPDPTGADLPPQSPTKPPPNPAPESARTPHPPPSDEPPLPYTFNNFDSFTITADRVTLNITLEVSWGSNASTGTGSRIIAFRRNNDAYYVAQNAITSNALPAPPSAVQMLSLSLVMQQGDKFHFDVLQSTGNLLDLISASSNPTSFCLLNIVSVY